MKINRSEKPGLLFGLLCLFKAVYVFVMIRMVPELWSNTYHFDKDINLNNIFYELPTFLVLVFVFIYYYRKDSSISFFTTLIFCLYVIPNNSTMVLSNYEFSYFFLINMYSFFLLFLLGKLTVKDSRNLVENEYTNIWDNAQLLKISRVATYIVCIITIVYVYMMGGLNFRVAFSASADMYAVRSKFAEFYAANTDSIISYFILIWSAVYSLMLPIGLYLSLKQRRIIDCCICIFTYMALFTLTMEKGIILRPIIVMFIVFMEKREDLQKAAYYFIAGFIGIMMISMFEKSTLGTDMLFHNVIQRTTYLPSYLSHTYYDYFSSTYKVWFTKDVFQLEKVFRLFMPNHYYTGIVPTIAGKYFAGIPSPNTGMFAEAYAQVGWLGVFIFPIIVAKLIDVLKNVSLWYGRGGCMIILASYCLSLINIQVLSSKMIIQIIIFALITYIIRSLIKIE